MRHARARHEFNGDCGDLSQYFESVQLDRIAMRPRRVCVKHGDNFPTDDKRHGRELLWFTAKLPEQRNVFSACAGRCFSRRRSRRFTDHRASTQRQRHSGYSLQIAPIRRFGFSPRDGLIALDDKQHAAIGKLRSVSNQCAQHIALASLVPDVIDGALQQREIRRRRRRRTAQLLFARGLQVCGNCPAERRTLKLTRPRVFAEPCKRLVEVGLQPRELFMDRAQPIIKMGFD
jgi:hypothetical protein